MSEKPRVRFAPSPTGNLHVGNARTALFNWLFARHYGGDFVVRIEDTDRARTFEKFEKGIIEDLRWLGIVWDEGPEKDGEFGPYHQFERIDIYNRYLKELVDEDNVYPCYCTEDELEAERNALLSRKVMPRYMGKCRNLTDEERRRLESEGRSPAFRFKVPEGVVEFNDLIRGPMKFDCDVIGDFIIVRSNGIPAYNFAVVIDDHLMKITHVIRGEDHLSNTPLQLLLYKALGFEPPLFAHHSLILGKDRSKLSKRHGAVSVSDFRDRGVLPEALLNYLSLLGGSFAGTREICSVDEIIEEFSLERAGRSGAIFDEGKLEWLNKAYIRNYSTPKLTELLVPFIEDAGYNCDTIDRKWLHSVVEAIRDNLGTFSEIGDYIDVFFDERYEVSGDAAQILKEEYAGAVVKSLHDALISEECAEDDLYRCVMDIVSSKTGFKGKKLFMPVRAAITGKTWGPELDRLFAILGKETLLKRVKQAIATVYGS
ncbi:MAG: glutamate--tRNA ligase [Proteobacteria bacterium]|nr:glutamate--tRNA ligase [Pseudomonadota bacterium]